MSAPWWLVASALKGLTEFEGTLDNPKIVEMFRLVGSGRVQDDETPWCAAFVGACLQLSGFASTNMLNARSYLELGEALGEPQPGCVVVLWRSARDGRKGHVGFFSHRDEQAGRIFLLGGNQSDGVNIAGYAQDRVLGYRWPTETAPVASSRLLPNIFQLGVTQGPVEAALDREEGQRWLRSAFEAAQDPPEFLPLSQGTNPGLRGMIEDVQQRLKVQGYAVGTIDGIYGLRTAAAVFSFQQANGIRPSGIVDAETWFRLQNGERMPLWAERRNETSQDLREEGSRTIALTDRGKELAVGAAALGAVGFVDARWGIMRGAGKTLDGATGTAQAAPVSASPSLTGWQMPAAAPDASVSLDAVLPVLLGSEGGIWVAMVAAAILLWRNADRTATQRVDEHRTGSNLRY